MQAQEESPLFLCCQAHPASQRSISHLKYGLACLRLRLACFCASIRPRRSGLMTFGWTCAIALTLNPTPAMILSTWSFCSLLTPCDSRKPCIWHKALSAKCKQCLLVDGILRLACILMHAAEAVLSSQRTQKTRQCLSFFQAHDMRCKSPSWDIPALKRCWHSLSGCTSSPGRHVAMQQPPQGALSFPECA